ncbi:hypothetical protein [Staphylococcus aureus]|uniref:hypothetical protein n=1 Tax=Staphylococcus aureus TaxID=1280 RepID=UPI0004F34645|nr:hypothetical protein [Staphylococcus aureus]
MWWRTFTLSKQNTHSEKLNFSLIANINKIDTKLFERLLKLWSKNATINEKYYQ